MHSADVHDLIERALVEEEMPPRLRRLITESAGARRAWSQQHRIDRLLRAEPAVAPPDHFTESVMERLDGELRRPIGLRPALGHLALLCTGTLALLWATVSIAQVWQLQDIAALALETLGRSAQGTADVFDAWIYATTGGSFSWAIYGALIAALAAAWFGALVLPRWDAPERAPVARR